MKKNDNRPLLVAIMLILIGAILVALFNPRKYLERDIFADPFERYVGEPHSSSSKVYERSEDFDLETIDGVVREKKVKLKGDGTDTVTVLIYMNGSDLESESGEATEDLNEILSAGGSNNVNVLVQTMNTRQWSEASGISSDRTERYKIIDGKLNPEDVSLSQLSCTEASTLSDFIIWGKENSPADRYILLFWNHGAGPVYGFGYDDITESEDSLTTAEIQEALDLSEVYFDFIGMDCCLMSSLEFCAAIYDFCDYCILSEDFESGFGWDYKGLFSKLYENSSTPTEELARLAIDDMVNVNIEEDEDAIMALIDESYMKVLFANWVNFAYANEKELLENNYSRRVSRRAGGRAPRVLLTKSSDEYEEDAQMADYYVSDIMALASNVNSEQSAALKASLDKALVYVNSCGSSSNLTGISVTLPYGDSEFYEQLSSVFSCCGLDSRYITWLGKFVYTKGANDYYDYEDWDEDWSGWDDYYDDFDWYDWGEEFGSDFDNAAYWNLDRYWYYDYEDWEADDFDWGDWYDWTDEDWYDDDYEYEEWSDDEDWDDDYWDDDWEDWDDDYDVYDWDDDDWGVDEDDW